MNLTSNLNEPIVRKLHNSDSSDTTDTTDTTDTDYRNNTCICCLLFKEKNEIKKCKRCGIIICKECSKDKWEYTCPHCRLVTQNDIEIQQEQETQIEQEEETINLEPCIMSFSDCCKKYSHLIYISIIVFIIFYLTLKSLINIMNSNTNNTNNTNININNTNINFYF